MTVLLLRLAGPLQAWGDASRFVRRDTRTEPTKSGVLGLLAAAQGRRRAELIEDLSALRFGVRVDQPGRLVRDFQTAIRWAKRESMPLSYRYYLSDAVFVAAVEGDDDLVLGLEEAIRSPAFPLYLGRRSCPPALPLSLGVAETGLEGALADAPWQAARWYRRRLRCGKVPLETFVDALDNEGRPQATGETSSVAPDVVRDVPQSWDPRRREYTWRAVVSLDPIDVDNPDGRAPAAIGAGLDSEPDFFVEAGGRPCT